MMRRLKIISTLSLAVVMLFAIGSVAFAEAATLSDGKAGNVGTALSEGISITKEIIFVNNEDTTSVREPNITYTYTVAAVTVGSTNAPKINDGTTTVPVQSGVLIANTNPDHKATVTFSDASAIGATTNGTANQKSFTLTFEATKFGNPGVYRYSVTESVSPTKTSVGISEAAVYASTRYLDVYVERNTSGTLEVYGYVLFESSDASKQILDTSAGKSNGWVDTDTNAQDTTHADVDVYTTQNLLISKTTTGSMADKTNDFPLSIALSTPSGVTAPKINVTTENNGAVTTVTTTDTVGTYVTLGTVDAKVRDSSTIKLTGIPANSTVAITETNNSSNAYKVKAEAQIGSAGATNILNEAQVTAGQAATATTSQTFTDKIHITFTNTFDAISPTGLVLRIAPYALMMTSCLVLLALARCHRTDVEDL